LKLNDIYEFELAKLNAQISQRKITRNILWTFSRDFFSVVHMWLSWWDIIAKQQS